jgi:DNA-binding response OmpR family regulator
MQPENSPRALPLVVVLYGQLRRAASGDPVLLNGYLVDHDRSSEGGAGMDAQRALRRGKLAGPVLEHRGLVIDTHARTVTFEGTGVELRRREYELLAHLVREPTRVFTRHELLRDVWGFKYDGMTRTVDSHASRLRRALACAGATGWIAAVRGVGYRLAP